MENHWSRSPIGQGPIETLRLNERPGLILRDGSGGTPDDEISLHELRTATPAKWAADNPDKCPPKRDNEDGVAYGNRVGQQYIAWKKSQRSA